MIWSMLLTTVTDLDNPLALVALVSVVAMLVVGQCVRYLCLVLSKKEGKE